MQCFRKVTEDLYWVGGNDRQIELFENIFPLAKGVSYNSYLLLDACGRSIQKMGAFCKDRRL